jgi:hypothetical protein
MKFSIVGRRCARRALPLLYCAFENVPQEQGVHVVSRSI